MIDELLSGSRMVFLCIINMTTLKVKIDSKIKVCTNSNASRSKTHYLCQFIDFKKIDNEKHKQRYLSRRSQRQHVLDNEARISTTGRPRKISMRMRYTMKQQSSPT